MARSKKLMPSDLGFAERLVILPAVMLHAIARNHGARSIAPRLQCTKTGPVLVSSRSGEHLYHLLIRRSAPCHHGDGYVLQASRSNHFFFNE